MRLISMIGNSSSIAPITSTIRMTKGERGQLCCLCTDSKGAASNFTGSFQSWDTTSMLPQSICSEWVVLGERHLFSRTKPQTPLYFTFVIASRPGCKRRNTEKSVCMDNTLSWLTVWVVTWPLIMWWTTHSRLWNWFLLVQQDWLAKGISNLKVRPWLKS